MASGGNYAKGYRIERELFYYFADRGYRVIRSAGSHEADLFVEGVGFIEVKYRKKLPSPVLIMKDVCFLTPSFKVYYLDDYINKIERPEIEVKNDMGLKSLFTSDCDCVVFRSARTRFYIAFHKS